MDITDIIDENKKLKEKIKELTQEIKKGEVRKKIIQDTNAMLDRSLYELSVINKINNLLSKTLDYDEIIHEIMVILSTMIEYTAIGILIKNEGVFLLKINLASPKAKGYILEFKKKALAKFRAIVGGVPENKVVVSVENQNMIIDDEEHAVIGCLKESPLVAGDKTIGLLVVANIKMFSQDEIRLINIVAENSAIAIENSLLHRKIEELAITDGLTGLYNHRYFKEALHKEIKRSERYNLVFSLIMFDIDDFKSINDRFGHPKGDCVLIGISQVIKNIFQREIDVGARYGGEEFIILLPQTTKENAYLVSKKMLSAIRNNAWKLAGHPEIVTVSIGISSYPQDGQNEEALIEAADSALYNAKKTGKNKVVVFNKSN
ncbi:TPA: hypothetical protein DCX16_07010 [bacterium]|nr:hypothetical protein [bacterium]